MSIAAGQVGSEYNPSYDRGGQIALYAGLPIGALFRHYRRYDRQKMAFNLTLLISSVSPPNYQADNWGHSEMHKNQ